MGKKRKKWKYTYIGKEKETCYSKKARGGLHVYAHMQARMQLSLSSAAWKLTNS